MATLKQLVDETTNIKNELVICHTNLKNNLIEKGVECSDTDKMSRLIDIVGNISTGKKWASGNNSKPTQLQTFYASGGSSRQFYYTDICLDFAPSCIVVITEAVSSTTGHFAVYLKQSKSCLVSYFSPNYITINGATFNVAIDNRIDLGDNIYRIPMDQNTLSVNWYAYE